MNKGIKHHVYKVLEYQIGMIFYEPSWDAPRVNELTLEQMNIRCLENDYVDITLEFHCDAGLADQTKYKLEDVGHYIFTSREDAERQVFEMYGVRLSEEQ